MFNVRRTARLAVAAALPILVLLADAALAGAQTAPDAAAAQQAPAAAPASRANTGRLSFSGSVDVLSGYMFRGIRQDDRGVIAWPALEVGVELFKSSGALTSVQVNAGLWNSLHSGPTGLSGETEKMWYESDFYTTLAFGVGNGVTVSTTYTAYMSPNSSFDTVREIALSLALDDSARKVPLAPYALVAHELDGQADGGAGAGTYLELGVAPARPLLDGRVALQFPLKLGLSLNDYYEGPHGSPTFGFVEAGVLAETPLRHVPEAFGAWSIRAGISVLSLGESLRAVNGGPRTKLVGLVGVALAY